ncbi:MAG: sigma-70 family RNA polymerase sigma factor [Isosphaeraceae bacterium]
MAGGTSVTLLHDIRILFDSGTASGLSDRQLLERFTRYGDASAFEVLVLRHGPMVLRVCRNRLHDPNDAQDAFQATFLILVRRSGSIRRRDSVGSWLYGVASRVAARVRIGAARRHAVEERAACRVPEAVDTSEGDEAEPEEFGPIVQEEVRRLPEKYRTVVVLCYWQGLTHEQAAAQLGIPLGTVRSRMARARDLLRRRLTRRGLTPLAGVVTAAMDGVSVIRLSPIPAELMQATVRAAVEVVSGPATGLVVSGAVASLVQRFIWSMTMIKIGGVAAGIVLVGIAGYGVGKAANPAGQSQELRQVAPERDSGLVRKEQPASPQPQAGTAAPAPRETQSNAPVKIASNVDGEVTIISLPAPGRHVKKGEVICVLDSAAIQDQLLGQRVVVESARAEYQNARLTREVAEIAVVEYQEGIFLSELQDIVGDIQIAEAELDLAEVELRAAKLIVPESAKGLGVKRAELDVFRAKIAIKKAKARRSLLVDYTKPRTIKQLKAEVEKARGDELSKQSIWDLEKTKQARLERQIANCAIVAPIDGYIRNSRVMGLKVHQQQTLFEIVPADGAKPQIPGSSQSTP